MNDSLTAIFEKLGLPPDTADQWNKLRKSIIRNTKTLEDALNAVDFSNLSKEEIKELVAWMPISTKRSEGERYEF